MYQPGRFGRHFAKQGWIPTPLLAFLVEWGLLPHMKIREAIVAFEKQTEVWLPEDRYQGCSIIGKLTQGQQGRRQKTKPEACDRPGRAGLPRAGRPPKRHPDPCFDYTVQSYGQQGSCRAYWSCDSGLSKPHCCREGFSYSPGQGCVPDANCTTPCVNGRNWMVMPKQGSCRMAAMPTSDRHFFEYVRGFGYVIRICAYGSLYSQSACKCVATDGPLKPQEKMCRPEIYIDFQDGAYDTSGNNLALTAKNLLVESGAGKFDGTSSLKVWRFSGVSFYKQITLTFRFRPRQSAARGLMMFLLGNCCYGCKNQPNTGPSITVGITPDANGGIAVFGAQTDEREEFLYIPYTNTNDGWVDMTFNYNGKFLSGTTNGVSGETALTGNIESRVDPLTLGTCADTSSFEGYIDDFKMYLCE